jgi:hypothetical protein
MVFIFSSFEKLHFLVNYLLTCAFCREMVNIASFYLKFISNPELPGSGSEIIHPDPDPAKSFGSDRIRIHNTVKYVSPVGPLTYNHFSPGSWGERDQDQEGAKEGGQKSHRWWDQRNVRQVNNNTMKRLDQDHLHPKLEVLSLTCLGQESNPGFPPVRG